MPASRCSVRVLLLLLLLPLAISVNAQSKPGTATVSGRVLVHGEPVRGAMIGLQGQQSLGQVVSDGLRARADEAGRYRIANVPAGRYSVIAAVPGFVSSGAGDSEPRGKTINVADGEQIENLDLELKRGGVIAGRVTDANGFPMVEERLSLYRVAPRGPAIWVMELGLGGSFEMFLTDDRGEYRLYGLPEGKYLLSAGVTSRTRPLGVARGVKMYPLTYYSGAASEQEAKPIEVTEGSETTGVDISFPEGKRTFSVLGRVVDADTGEPVPNAEILSGTPGPDGARLSSWGSSGVRSNASGEFQLLGALPGRYGLFIGNSMAIVAGNAGGEFISEPVFVEVRDGDVSGIEIRARRGASISGTVVFDSAVSSDARSRMSRVTFWAMNRPGNAGNSTVPSNKTFQPNADGSFRLSGLGEGQLDIQLVGSSGLSILRIESDGAPVNGPLDLKLGAALANVRIVLTQGNLKVRGDVRLVGGTLPSTLKLVASARRVGETSMRNNFYSEVDARGQFMIENLTPGEYEISVGPIFNGPYPFDPKLMALFRNARQKVVVGNGGVPPLAFTIDLAPKEGNR